MGAMSDAPISYHFSPQRPRIALPSAACDAHVHVFGPATKFPFAADRAFTPCEAPKERLFALHAQLGVKRCVVVQSTAHGYDNGATEDAIRARPGEYVGIALLPLDVSDVELRRLDAAGFRGVRFHFAGHLGPAVAVDEIVRFGARLAELGWHLQIHLESARIAELAPSLARSPVPVVIDHMGRVDASRGLDHPHFRALRDLLVHRHVWVKVSGSDRVSKDGPPYADAVPFARTLVQDAGDRLVWGTDWPHPNHTHVPDDGVLVDLLAEIAPAQSERHALLVDNPQRLYRFGS